jgi:hypothetical protein
MLLIGRGLLESAGAVLLEWGLIHSLGPTPRGRTLFGHSHVGCCPRFFFWPNSDR